MMNSFILFLILLWMSFWMLSSILEIFWQVFVIFFKVHPFRPSFCKKQNYFESRVCLTMVNVFFFYLFTKIYFSMHHVAICTILLWVRWQCEYVEVSTYTRLFLYLSAPNKIPSLNPLLAEFFISSFLVT